MKQQDRVQKHILTPVFALMNYISESSSYSSKFIFATLITIESLQILYFSFYGLFAQYWDSELSWLQRIVTDCHYFFPGLKSDMLIFKTLLSVYIFLLTTIGIFLVSAMLILVRNKKIPNFVVFILKQFLMLIPITFIPFLTLFLQIMKCQDGIFQMNSSIDYCWSPEHFGLFCVCFIYVICLLGFSLVMTSLNSSATSTNQNYQSQLISSNYDMIFLVKKIVLVFAYEFSQYFQNYSNWILALLNLIFSFSNFLILLFNKPYFNAAIQKTQLALRGIELFSSIFLVLNLIISGDLQYKGTLSLIVLGFGMISFYFLIFSNDRLEFYLQESKLTPSRIIKKIVFMINWFEDNSKRENYTIGRALVIVDNSFMELKQASIYSKRRVMIEKIEEANVFLSSKSNVLSNKNLKMHKNLIIEESQLVLDYLSELYEAAIEIMPKSLELRLYYLDFVLKYLKNNYLAEYLIAEIKQRKLNIKEEYFLFQLELCKSRFISKLTNRETKNNMIETDMIQQFNLETDYDLFINLLKSSCYSLIKLWEMISTNDHNEGKLKKVVIEIYDQIHQLKGDLKYKPSIFQDIRTYDILFKYYNLVLNSNFVDQADVHYKKNIETSSNNQYIRSNILNYIQDGNAYIVANGEEYFLVGNRGAIDSNMRELKTKQLIGDVLSLNSTACAMFGITKAEGLSMNLNDLMPEIMRTLHEKNLKRIFETDIQTVRNKEFKRIFTIALHRSGYIFPLNMTLTLITNVNSKLCLLGLIRIPSSDNFKLNHCYMLADTKFNLLNISSQASNLLGLSVKDLTFTNYRQYKKKTFKDSSNRIKYIDSNHTDNNQLKLLHANVTRKPSDSLAQINSTSITAKQNEIFKKFIKLENVIPELAKAKENLNLLDLYEFEKTCNDTQKVRKIVDVVIFKGNKAKEKINLAFNSSKQIAKSNFYNEKLSNHHTTLPFYIIISKLKINVKLIGYIVELQPAVVETKINRVITYNPVFLKYSLSSRNFVCANPKNIIMDGANKCSSDLLSNKKEKQKANNDLTEKGMLKEIQIFLAEHNLINYSQKINSKVINIKGKGFRSMDRGDTRGEVFKRLYLLRQYSKLDEHLLDEEVTSASKENHDLFNYESFNNKFKLMKKAQFKSSNSSIHYLLMKIFLVISFAFKIGLTVGLYSSNNDLLTSISLINNWNNISNSIYFASTKLLVGLNSFQKLGYTDEKFDNFLKSNLEGYMNSLLQAYNCSNIEVLYPTQSKFKFASGISFYNISRLEAYEKIYTSLINVIYYKNLNTEQDYQLSLDSVKLNIQNSLFEITEYVSSNNNLLLTTKIQDQVSFSFILLYISISCLVFVIPLIVTIVKLEKENLKALQLIYHVPLKSTYEYLSKIDLFLKFIKTKMSSQLESFTQNKVSVSQMSDGNRYDNSLTSIDENNNNINEEAGKSNKYLRSYNNDLKGKSLLIKFN